MSEHVGRPIMKEIRWEKIDTKHHRAKVFGGWLVKVLEPSRTLNVNVCDWYIAVAYVPDPNYEWIIEEFQYGQ